MLVNGLWLSLFPLSETNFLLPGISNHSPSITTVRGNHSGKPKPFKFFDMWMEHPNFLKVIKEVWEVPVARNPLFRVVQKLKTMKFKLKDWNRNVFGCFDLQLKTAREDVQNSRSKESSMG